MIDILSLPEHQRTTKSLDIKYNNIQELFSEKVVKTPNKKFLICPGKETDEFTYAELDFLVKKTVTYLKKLNLVKNNKICLIFHNSSEFLVLYFAALRLGITIVPINPDMASTEIDYIVKDCGAKTVFYSNTLEQKMRAIYEKNEKVKFEKISSVLELTKILETIETKNEKVELQDLAVIIYTSGTTGNPKGVKLTHLNILADAYAISRWFEFNEDTRTLCILPLFHNNGQITTLLAPLYAGGSTVIIKGKTSLNSFWDIVNQYKITWTSMMASILSILISLPKERTDNSLKAILCGGQVLTRTVQNNFEKRFGVPIFEGYGLTETTSFSCINNYPSQKRKIGTIGKPLITNEMEILDVTGNIQKPNVEGEICIRGFNVSLGYLGMEEKNKESFRNGWFHSNDFGRKDEEGYFYIHGRKDSLIIKGGENIYPAELENVLYQHPNVEECAVIGIPDKLLGEELCAFIKIDDGSEVNEENLKKFCRDKIASFKQPKKIVIINNLKNLKEIPKGSTKKILYKDLKKFYQDNMEN